SQSRPTPTCFADWPTVKFVTSPRSNCLRVVAVAALSAPSRNSVGPAGVGQPTPRTWRLGVSTSRIGPYRTG
ncbi:hypothetical protein PHET_12339, partial [Paragonimus heterotremus]